MPEPEDLKVGDIVTTQITGAGGFYRAKVIEFDTRYSHNRPVLQLVLEDDTPDPEWPYRLKDGDYIIRERVPASKSPR